jgi:predicted TIM-barrel fold metal-dependent hydrolase
MPIFDSQAFVEGYALPGVSHNAQQVAQALKQRGIDTAILFSSRAAQLDPLSGNKLLKAMLEPFPTLCAGLTAQLSRMDASLQAVRDLMAGRRFVGVYLVGEDVNAPLNIRNAEEILNSCRRYQKPIFLPTPNGHCVETALHLAKSFSMHKFVFLGMGGKEWRAAVSAADSAVNVHLEISGVLDPNKIPAAIEAIGGHRLLFGSSYPRQDPAATLGLLEEAEVTAINRQRILFDNMMKLLNLGDS